MVEEISPVPAEISSEAKVTVSSEKIKKGISALKKVHQWPEEGQESTPLDDDDSATIYLQCTPRQQHWQPVGSRGKDVRLPHPLSFNRSVCLIVPDTYTEQDEEQWTTLLKEIGVKKEIKVMPRSEIIVPIRQKATYFVEELATAYDVHLADMKTIRLIYKGAVPILYKHGKNLNRVELKKDPMQHFQAAFSKSPLTINSLEKAYAWKVAHTGQSDVQIVENIEAALKTISALDKSFPGGLEYFRSVQLKTGSSDGVAIYVNDAEMPAEAPPAEKKKKQKGAADGSNSQRNLKRKSSEETPAAEGQEQESVAEWMPIVEVGEGEGSASIADGKSKKKKKKKSNGDATVETSQKEDSDCNVDGESKTKKKKRKKEQV